MAEPQKQQMGDGSDNIGQAAGQAVKQAAKKGAEAAANAAAATVKAGVEGGKAVTHHFGRRVAYINVLRNMSVSCDCEGVRAEPVRVPDLGILASSDILAVDKASVDMVYALPEDVRAPLVERIESRSGLRQLSCMKEMGMGDDDYELITVA